jgi:L-ribulose-5-phosphate 3-epimerase
MRKLYLLFLSLFLFAYIHGEEPVFFKLSLAEWSLHQALEKKEITNLDFPRIARKQYDLEAIEFVDRFFPEGFEGSDYLKKLKDSCDHYEVKSLLIMIDKAGNLGDTSEIARIIAVHKHIQWLKTAQYLGCHSIRINASEGGDSIMVRKAVIKSISELCDSASTFGLNVIIENHWGYSSNADWLVGVIKEVNRKNCGTLPDFGNFSTYNKYLGVEKMLPYAKGVSGKSRDFDKNGNEVNIDYFQMLQLIKKSGFEGYIDIEYEGKGLTEDEGIRATKALLLKAGKGW